MASKVQDCDCGFVDSADPSESIFTSFLAVDFTSTSSKDFDNIFISASYDVFKDGSPYTRDFSPDQVQLSEDGLALIVSPVSKSESVPCAQIFTRDSTFFYGSYHVQLQASNVAGTTTAFFNYKNDSSEVDIEYLNAWDDATLLYTTKPQIYSASGTPSNLTYQRERWNDTSVAFYDDSHDWSFIWLPEIVYFGLDEEYSRYIDTNVPQAPGRLAISQWSDGNPNYSLGPPDKDSTVTVSYLWAVYNSTGAKELACKKTDSTCTISKGVFQPSNASGGGDDSGSPPVIDINSASPRVEPMAFNLLFGFFFLFWVTSWRSA
ncbi:hypothetical protein N3K66_002830 [Trichothecium roseum]|uniref:Uncharacterized protein n=1 Tax=Trichothecium roseum TaxID=47278 RepID=A0ACC0V3Q5_9HYPO|nr:hypothetical protein N3K66_002830 [Trichothecium roseum]